MHLAKKGLRVLGIAESYSGRERSTLAGVVMRGDLRIDGMVFSQVTVGGMDATDAVLAMVHDLARKDINVLMLGGCVIAWYNILNPETISQKTGIPVIAITYEDSEGLNEDIERHFPGDMARLEAYLALGHRTPHRLPTGFSVFLRSWGVAAVDAGRICDRFSFDGRVPEPVKVARLAARAMHRSGG
jgi:endonuclease V-like protein UPF0215 family